MNRKLSGMAATVFAFCSILSCSDRSSQITDIALKDSTVQEARALPVAAKPSAVTDLQASATGSSSVTLSFTQVDDGTGQPAKYDVRYAVSPIQWGAAASATSGTCSTPVAGTATGSQLSCTVLGLTPATSYGFQLIAFRGTMNLNAVYGPVSNIVSATTTATAPPPPVPVASVSVSPASSSLLIGATVQLLVTARDANDSVLTGRIVTSSSADAAIASVNSLGLVMAIGAGTTQITVTSEGKSAIATIIVTAPPPPPVPVASVSVSPATSNLIIGATVQLLVTARDANGNVLTGRVVTSSSANAGIASVNSLGLVTAVSAGTTGITVTSEGQSAVATINVSAPAPVPVATVSISPASSSLLIGATVQLAATTRDANNNVLTGRAVSWSSSNTGISTVSASGLVTAIGAGSATITATSETKTGAAAVTVSAPPPAPVASVSVTPATPSLQVGETVQLSAVTRDANNNVLTGRAVSWTSSNTGVGTVSSSGLVSALAAGPAQITATSENQGGSAALTVAAPPPPPPPGGSAEPAGMTRITENDFTAPNQNGWYFEYGQVNAATVQDASAPRSPSGVLQLTYPAGMAGGTGPNSLENDWSSGTYKTLYVASWMKVSSNFYGHCGPAVTKTLHVWVSDGTTSGNRLYSNVRGCGTEALSYWVNLQGVVAGGDVDNGTSAELAPNLGQPATIVRGQWQKYELVIKANSAGTRDGTVDWWLDGVHVGSYTGIQFVPGNATWDLMKWNPTWGGLGGIVPAAFTESLDHIYVSGKR